MLFAAFVLDREPLQWSELPAVFWAWTQSAGWVSALALLIFTFVALMRSQQSTRKRTDAGPLTLLLCLPLTPIALFLWFMLTVKKRWQPSERAMQLPLLYLGATLTLGFYITYFAVRMFGIFDAIRGPIGNTGMTLRQLLLAAGGLCALVLAMAPMALSVATRIRFGRIWALAKLSFKEAIRSRVVLVFSIMAVVFLFADWFVDVSKSENQVRNYVTVVYWSMAPLFLMVASILGAFSIPNDIKNQSIHTIATKPVEKLEIVLGRFLGFAMLLTIGLAGVTAVSYLYILRGIDSEAVKESFHARVPIVGNLHFSDLDGVRKDKWDNPGREWAYRSYITGPHGGGTKHTRNFAVWEFDNLPASLGESGPVQVEFTFDIFRLHKGKEGVPVFCSFTFVDGSKDMRQIEQIRNEVRAKFSSQKPKTRERWTKEEGERYNRELMREYGFYSPPDQPVKDYHTQSIEIPAEFFKRLQELRQQRGQGKGQGPILKILVEVSPTSQAQMIGVARRDLYILEADKPFWLNFIKGVIGMWCSLLLVLGVAIACSTYLSGVISWFTTLFLYGTGLCNDYVRGLATGTAYGGGPAEAGYRLYERRPITVPADDAPLAALITRVDDFYRWWLQMMLNIIPDVNRFDLINYVANGFDISWGQVLFLDNIVYLASYLLPWVVLSYYLMKFREIANPT